MGIKRKTKADNSFIAKQTGKISEKLCEYADSSIAARCIKNVGKKNNDRSCFTPAVLLKKTKLQEKVFSPFKRAFAVSVENSAICSLYRSVVSSLLLSPTYVVAVFFLVFAFYCNITITVKILFDQTSSAQIRDFLTPVSVLLMSFILIVCRESIVSKLAGSRFFSFFLYDILMLDHIGDYGKNDEKAVAGKKKVSLIIPAVSGVIFGIAAMYSTPEDVLIFLGLMVGVAVVMYSPETGLSLSLFIFPFVSEKLLTLCSAVMLVSFIIKLMRGKRNISFCYIDIIVILLGAFCYGISKSGYAFTATAVYLVAVNTVKTKRILRNCVSALSFGFVICVVFGASELVIQALDSYVKSDSFAIHSIGSIAALGVDFVIYAICVLPFFLFRAKLSGFSRFSGVLILFLLCAVCLVDGLSVSLPILIISLILCFVISTARVFEGTVAVLFSSFLMMKFVEFDNSLGEIVEKNIGVITREVSSLGELFFGKKGALCDPGMSGFSSIILGGGIVMLAVVVVAVVLLLCNVLYRITLTKDKTVYILCIVPLFVIFSFSFQFNLFNTGMITVVAFSTAMGRIENAYARPSEFELPIANY